MYAKYSILSHFELFKVGFVVSNETNADCNEFNFCFLKLYTKYHNIYGQFINIL